MNKKLKPTTCAIVVTFKPDIHLLESNLKKIISQVDHIFVVDNTPKEGFELQEIKRIVSSVEEITLIENGENKGIAKALNQGILVALKNKFDYITTLDQDSCPQPNMVYNLISFLENSVEKNCIAVPQIHDKMETNIITKIPKEIESAITSGMTFSSKIPERYGLMMEKLFIDYVDIEYCLRLRNNKVKIILIPGSELKHSLGDLSEIKIFNKTYYPTNHSAFRRYFITRNRVFVWFKYYYIFPKWVIKDIKASVIELVLILKAENNKLEKCLAILKGIKDVTLSKYNN